MKHPVLLTLGCFVLIFACWSGWAIYRDRQLSDGFDKVKTGASESEVSATLGKPKRVERCGEFFGPLLKDLPVGCASEYVYASPFAPLLPTYYVVRFDASGRVLETVPLYSP